MVKAWEAKNAKRAVKASGATLMALSLSACGSEDEVAAPVTPVTPVTPVAKPFELTPLVDIASGTQALNGSLANAFRFTDGNDTVTAISATIAADDTLIDGSTTDSDVINITHTGGTMAAMSAINIETANVTFASGASSIASFTNFTGLKTVNVDGSVAAKVLNADGATISASKYTRELTIESSTFAGNTAAGSAETVNVTVSGATYGTTAATQSSIVVSATTNGTLETLNVTSAGDSANVFALASGGSDSFKTINVLGSADATIRVAKGDVSGNTVSGTGSTGTVSLSLDVNSSGATAVNAANWTGIDNLVLRDSATASATDAATFNSVKSGQNVVVANSVGTLTVAAQAATYTAEAASAGLELNGTSTTAGVTVGAYAAENITALNLVSTGLASSTSTTAANTVSSIDGDFSTITITGDTSVALSSLAIDNKQTATGDTAARAVTVDASAMTGNAFLDITAAGGAKVVYTITGTAGADTIVVNDAGSTVVAGDGKDTITGGTGKDTIDGGAANDHIDVSYGKDTLTGGAGNDTFDIDLTAVGASAQVASYIAGTGAADAATTLAVTVGGATYSAADAADAAGSLATAFITAHSSAFQGLGIDLSKSGSGATEKLVFTAQTAGSEFTISTVTKGGTAVTADAGTQANVVAADVDTTITDFTSGDIIDTVGLSALGATYYEGAASGLATTVDYGVIVLTGATYATANAAEQAVQTVVSGANNVDGTADAIIVFLNSTTGTAQAAFDADQDTDGNLADSTVLVTFESITTLTDLASVMSADSFVI